MEIEIYNKFLEEASDGILAVNKDGFICFWNKYAGEIFGYSKDNVVGCSLNMIIPEKHRQRHWDAFFNVMKTGKSKYAAGEKLSVPALTKDGKTVLIEFTITMIKDESGNIKYCFAIIREKIKK